MEVFGVPKDGTYKSLFHPKDSIYFSIVPFNHFFERFIEIRSQYLLNIRPRHTFCSILGLSLILLSNFL